VERESIAEEDAYSYHLANPLKCACANIDEYINRSKKACYHIRQELSVLSELLHKQQAVSSKINGINAEINKRFNPPTFLQSVARDFMFAGKIFLIMLGSVVGLEILLFIITLLMFFAGLALGMEDLSRAGNELFYNLNIFKDRGAAFLSGFGWADEVPLLESEAASQQIIVNYIPYALAGVFSVIFYIALAILIIRVGVNLFKLVFFASKVMNQKIRINQRREAYERELEDLTHESHGLEERIAELDILARDYKNLRAADMILKYFDNNRVDTIRDAVNLYHEDDFKARQLEYSKALYTEAKQTRRYTTAMYMLSSDSNIKVEVREDPPESAAKSPAKSKKPAAQKQRLPQKSAISGSLKSPENKKPERESEAGKAQEQKEPEKKAEVRPDPGKAKTESSRTETFGAIFEQKSDEQSNPPKDAEAARE
jgi:cell division protein FtsB